MARILLAEDDPEIRGHLMQALTRAGHDVRTVMDGRSAYLAVKRDNYELVVTDWMMPGLSGIDLIRMIRSDPEVAHLPVLILTGRGATPDLALGYAVGANDYLVKPFSSRELTYRVSAILRTHWAREWHPDET